MNPTGIASRAASRPACVITPHPLPVRSFGGMQEPPSLRSGSPSMLSRAPTGEGSPVRSGEYRTHGSGAGSPTSHRGGTGPAAAEGALRFLHEHVGLGPLDGDPRRGRAPDRADAPARRASSGPAPGSRGPRASAARWSRASAPRVATVTAAVPEYASRTKGLGTDVAAYIGVPLVHPDARAVRHPLRCLVPGQAAERRPGTCRWWR